MTKLAVEAASARQEVRCSNCGVLQVVPEPATRETDAELRAKPLRDDILAATSLPEFSSREAPEIEEYRYAAFISYRHVEPDRTMAKWLHSELETYRVPRRLALARGFPRRLGRVFRDEEELPASADLSREIERALKQSRFLIVVCSARTPASDWVNAEVVRFRQMGRHDQILALLIEGEPAESFPQALREIRQTVVDEEGLSREEIEKVEPLADDVRRLRNESERALKRKAKLRMLACILGCHFDDLRRREHQWPARRIAYLVVLLAISIIVMAGLTFIALAQRKAAMVQRAEAVAQKVLPDEQRGSAER